MTGFLIAIVPGQILVLLGLGSCIVRQLEPFFDQYLTVLAKVSCILFSLINTHVSYWVMTFIIMITLPVLDIAYTVANMQVCSSFQRDSQALAGSLFSVATRVRIILSYPFWHGLIINCFCAQLGTSIGLAVTSSIAQSVTEKYVRNHPDVSSTDPVALLPGFRAAGWTCVGAASISVIIAIVGLRGIGLVGQAGPSEDKRLADLELAAMGHTVDVQPQSRTISAQSSMSPIMLQNHDTASTGPEKAEPSSTKN